jgi:hypothetical protein
MTSAGGRSSIRASFERSPLGIEKEITARYIVDEATGETNRNTSPRNS